MTIPSLVPALYVNGERVPEELVAEEAHGLRSLPHFAGIAESAVRDQQIVVAALNGAIDRVLIKQEAEKDASPVGEFEIASELDRLCQPGACGPSAKRALLRAQAETQARFTRTVRSLIGSKRPPTHADVKAVFEQNQDKFQFPERVESAHVLKKVDEGRSDAEARSQIARALEEIELGGDFGQIVRRHSDCPDADGVIGTFARGEGLVPQYEAVIFGLQPGQHSGIFRTGFGYHIAKTIAKYPARKATFKEVKEDIVRELTAKAESEALRVALGRLRAGAKITTQT